MVDLVFLASIPIFSFFTRPELEAAEKLFREVTFAKHDVVVKLGDPGDTFYVVLDGELEVWDASQPPRQTGTLRRGDFFGEMALLQGGVRTATVVAARRVRVLAVDKPAFEQLFLQNPKAIEYFARVLSKRLAGVTRAQRIRRATTTIAVASHRGLKGETLVAHSLAAVGHGRAEVVPIPSTPRGSRVESAGTCSSTSATRRTCSLPSRRTAATFVTTGRVRTPLSPAAWQDVGRGNGSARRPAITARSGAWSTW